MSDMVGRASGAVGRSGNILVPATNDIDEGNVHAFLTESPTRVLGVTFDQSIEEWLATYHHLTPENLAVISVGEAVRSTATVGTPSAGGMAPRAGPGIETVSDGTDLPALGLKLLTHLQERQDTPASNELVVCFDTTGLLDAVSLRYAFRFLHLLTHTITHYGAIAHYHLDPTRHDPATLKTVRVLFTTMLETGESSNPDDWSLTNTVSH